MKKALCIKDSTTTRLFRDGRIDRMPSDERVFCGEIYTIIGTSDWGGRLAYRLAERPFQNHYKSEYFAPLSEIDETEMIRENNKVEAQNI